MQYGRVLNGPRDTVALAALVWTLSSLALMSPVGRELATALVAVLGVGLTAAVLQTPPDPSIVIWGVQWTIVGGYVALGGTVVGISLLQLRVN